MSGKSTSLVPKLSNFGEPLAWLLGKEVPASRLAGIFGTTAENIRVIAFRARQAHPFDSPKTPTLDAKPSEDLANRLGIRDHDYVIRTPARQRSLEWLRNQFEEITRRGTTDYQFLSGIETLRGLLPYIGRAGDARRIALSALLHQQTAWFLVHTGQCASATEQAAIARELWRCAYHESESKEYAAGFIQSALIGSNASLLQRRPHDALAILDVAKDAAEAIGARLGSEPFRQRGVALFQLREDGRAGPYFERASEAMEKFDEAQRPEQLLMTGVRHTNLLGTPNFDSAQQLVCTARRSFGEQSLEAAMALHWAAGCGLSTDSESAMRQALDLMEAAAQPAPQFGHQFTIRKLLAITPALGLDVRLRPAWVRRALYENAFSHR